MTPSVDSRAPRLTHYDDDTLVTWLGSLARIRDVSALRSFASEYSQPIRLARAGADGHLDYRTLEPAEHARLSAAPGHWWRFDTLECHVAAVRATLTELAREQPGAPAPGHATGYFHAEGASVPRHCDRPTVLVVQLFGHRTWRLEANDPTPVGLDDPVEAPTPFRGWHPAFSAASTTVKLARGSALTVPSGWWHQTWSEEPSFSVSFVLSTPA